MADPGLGALITVSDLAVGIAIGWSRTKAQRKLHRLQTTGRLARGELLDVQHTNVTVNDQPLMLIKLRIHGADVAPFEVEDRQVISPLRMPVLQGREVPVLVDPETKEWEIDWDHARAELPWTPLDPTVSNAPPVEESAAERLGELDDLLRQDLISRDEYDATRTRILDDI